MEHPGEQKCAKGPDPQANERFVEGWQVFNDLSQRGGNKTRNNESHAFFDPDPQKYSNTCYIQVAQPLTQRGNQNDQTYKV